MEGFLTCLARLYLRLNCPEAAARIMNSHDQLTTVLMDLKIADCSDADYANNFMCIRSAVDDASPQ